VSQGMWQDLKCEGQNHTHHPVTAPDPDVRLVFRQKFLVIF